MAIREASIFREDFLQTDRRPTLVPKDLREGGMKRISLIDEDHK
jgi:hypothetical protein